MRFDEGETTWPERLPARRLTDVAYFEEASRMSDIHFFFAAVLDLDFIPSYILTMQHDKQYRIFVRAAWWWWHHGLNAG